jgi:hypothetical protein
MGVVLLVDLAVTMERSRVMTKKAIASQVVNLARTLVVWEPKTLSASPPPNAAPRPSLRGRCIKTTTTIKTHTKMCKVIKTGKSIDIGKRRKVND